jgi:hypothetical protein
MQCATFNVFRLQYCVSCFHRICIVYCFIQTRIPRTLIHACFFSGVQSLALAIVHNDMSNQIPCPTFCHRRGFSCSEQGPPSIISKLSFLPLSRIKGSPLVLHVVVHRNGWPVDCSIVTKSMCSLFFGKPTSGGARRRGASFAGTWKEPFLHNPRVCNRHRCSSRHGWIGWPVIESLCSDSSVRHDYFTRFQWHFGSLVIRRGTEHRPSRHWRRFRFAP